MSNRRLPDLFSQIQAAAVPSRIVFEMLKKWGFTSTTERSFISLLKKLGFLNENGEPTERYKEYRHKKNAPKVLADGIRELYSELFAVNENVYREGVDAVKGVVSRVTGR